MRRTAIVAISLIMLGAAAQSQPVTKDAGSEAKAPNPCRDDVAAALGKLRKSSWFTMTSHMITEKGPATMQVDYILPDRMHQKITNVATKKTSEIILVGMEAWSREGEGQWTPLKAKIAGQLQTQMQESVIDQQKDVGEYTCNGRTKHEGRDVASYKLESQPGKEDKFKNQTYRMFYIDAMTGLPVSAELLVPGHEERPIFKTTYAFPLDLKIEPPTDIAPATAPPAATPPAAPAEGATPAPKN
jgi:hypothetical protein